MVLYGTLKDEKLFYSVTGFHFSDEVYGYVRGKVYEIVDYTEPKKIFTYPLFVPHSIGSKIIAKEVGIQVDDFNKNNFWENLYFFEGDLYKLKFVTFYPINKKPHRSKAYVGNLKNIRSNICIIRVNTLFYLW